MKREVFRARDVDVSRMGVPILRHLDFNLFSGEILGVFGTFDSGRSTLLELIEGSVKPSYGALFSEGRLIENGATPWPVVTRISKRPMLLKGLTLWENLFVLSGGKPLLHPVWSGKRRQYAALLFQEYGLDLDPSRKVEELTVFQRLLVEILKARLNKAQIILIESFVWESTPADQLVLKRLLEQLTREGISFVISNYNIDQLKLYADRIAVMHGGRITKTVLNTPECQEQLNLVVSALFPPQKQQTVQRARGDIAFSVRNLRAGWAEPVSFELYGGEIVSIIDPSKLVLNAVRIAVLQGCPPSEGRLQYGAGPWHPLDGSRCWNRFLYVEHDAYRYYLHGMTVTENICMGLSGRRFRMGVINSGVIRVIEEDFASYYGRDLLGRSDCRDLTVQEQMALFLYRLRLIRPAVLVCRNLASETDLIMYHMLVDCLNDLAADGTAVCMMDSNLDRLTDISDRYLIPTKNGPLQEVPYSRVNRILGSD